MCVCTIARKSKDSDVYYKIATSRSPFDYYHENRKLYLKFIHLKLNNKYKTQLSEKNWKTSGFKHCLLKAGLELMRPRMVFYILLGMPSIFKNSVEINEFRNEFRKNIEFLKAQFSPGYFASLREILNVINFSLFSFYLSYHNKCNRPLFEKLCQFFRYTCPALNYVAEHCKKPIVKGPRIKIGFISRFLSHNHSVCRDRMGIILNLAKDIFDVYLIVNEKPSNELGRELWNGCENKIVVPDGDIEFCKTKIESLRLDILVYCEIGMDATCYFLSFLRLAPIQCNTWGHSETSGIDTIDYYFSSEYYELPSNKRSSAHYSEKLIKLNSLCTYYYNPLNLMDNKDEAMSYEVPGLIKNGHIYACLQSHLKMHPEFDEIIGNILERDPEAQVILQDRRKLAAQWLPRLKKCVFFK